MSRISKRNFDLAGRSKFLTGEYAVLSAAFLAVFFVLLLAFPELAYANNTASGIRSFTVGGLVCEVNQTCRGGWTDMFHVSNISDAHGEMANSSEYAYKVCCVTNETAVNWLGNNCSQKYWTMLHISNETNAHAELPNNSLLGINLCINMNTTRYVFNWTYSQNCSGYGDCIFSISNETNAHFAGCGADTSYALKLCADIKFDRTLPSVNLLTPANNTNFSSASVEFNYTVDDDNNIANCSFIANSTVISTSSSITKIANQTFLPSLSQGSFNWTVNCTDSNSNTGTAGMRRLSIRGMDCEVAASCQSGYYDLLHMNDTTNAHAELPNRSIFSYKICCKSNIAGASLTANCSSAFGSSWTMLHLYQETNSHVEMNNRSIYNISACMNLNSTAYIMSCSYKTTCAYAETCVAAVNQETNSHVSGCASEAYGTRLCCQIEKDTTPPVARLISPANGSTWDGDATATVTFTYNVTDANNIVNCSLFVDSAFDQVDNTITKDTSQSFLKDFMLSANHTWYVKCVDAANNIGLQPSWQFNFSRSVIPETPNITFVFPTPANSERQVKNWIYVNVTVNTTLNNVSACLLGWNSGAGEVNETMSKIGTGTNATCWLNKTTVDGTTYTFRVYANDTTNTFGMSGQRSNIENSIPGAVAALVYPKVNQSTTNRTLQFNWSASSDSEGDALTYEVNISCFPACSADNRKVNSSANQNWTTLDSRLRYFWDDTFYYNWTVRVWDGYEVSDWTVPQNFTLASYVALSLPTEKVNFSTLTPGSTEDTTSDNPAPLVLQNDGNSFADINLSIFQNNWLWTSIAAAASDYFRYKIDSVLGESGAFNAAGSQTTLAQVPQSNFTVIDNLNYTDASDSAEIDVSITVPPNEGAGIKSSQMVFTGWYVREL
ncbi:MAG: hypothetical protein V1886_00620 [archaeon]